MRFKGNASNPSIPRPMEVWNANVYFDDRSGAKNRPVIVLERRGEEFTIFMITSHERMPGTDMKLYDPYEVMLDKTSTVRTDRLFKIPPSKFNYKLGDLVEEDADMVRAVFARLKETRSYRRNIYRSGDAGCMRLPRRSCPDAEVTCAST